MIVTRQIHSFSIDKTTRAEITLIDPAYIRIYDESRRAGARLSGKFNVPAGKLEFTEACKASFDFIVPASYPPVRFQNGICFDSVRGVHVLFGGRTLDPPVDYSDTWEYNGTVWTQVFPTLIPSTKYGHKLAYDKARATVVMVGGSPNGNEIWEYDGADWKLTGNLPFPVYDAAMAYDEDAQIVFIYAKGRTFRYNGSLTELFPTTQPEYNPDLIGAICIYDVHRKRVVLWNGFAHDSPNNNVIYSGMIYEYYSANWHRTQSGVIETTFPGMFYDRKNRCSVLFGGFRGFDPSIGGEYQNKVWAYDGISFHELQHNNKKNDCGYGQVSYDENELLGVVFGVTNFFGDADRTTNTLKVSLSDPLAIATLPKWNPRAVKGWEAFSERSRKPSGTSILWRLGDGTSERWFDGAAWVPAVSPDEWNSETEVSAALSLFPLTARTIAPVAKLVTLDRFATPVLLGYDLLIRAVFDWFEDLVLRSIVPRLKTDFRFITDFSAVLAVGASGFNYKTDRAFIPEQDINIVGVDSVFNHTLDSDHITDILSSYNVGTGAVTLTGPVLAGTRLFIRYLVDPEVVVNFANSDYYEIGKTPTIVIENIAIEAQRVQAFRELADRARDQGWELILPLWVKEMTFNCVLMTGGLVDLFRFYSRAAKLTLQGTHNPSDPQGALLSTPALDRNYTLKFLPESRYNPKPNLADLKSVSFGLAVCDFYAWLRDLEETPIAKRMNCTVTYKDTSGPAMGASLPVQPEPGEFGFLNTLPEVEDETTTEPGN